MAVVVRLRSASGVALLVILALLWQQFGRRRPPSECASPLLLYTAHKTGTILAKHLAAAVNEQLKLPCHAVLQVDYNCPPEIGAPGPESPSKPRSAFSVASPPKRRGRRLNPDKGGQ